MVAAPGHRPKDFAFVKKDGVYHLFYIRHNDGFPQWATEVDFGHAISTDLYHWTQLPPVMAIDPAGWDNFHVWAPHVVEWGGFWWMFYTGVTDQLPNYRDTQRIGAAVSTDLMTWNRVTDGPVWANGMAPWAWWSPRSTAMACRDPFVMPDPSRPGEWLLYYTATPASDTTSTLVGVARSTGDLAAWDDEKPLWITHWTNSFNLLAESPHVFEHDGLWFMFISANATQALSFYTSPDPLGDPAAWRYRGRLRNMLGYDTSQWFASEVLKDGEHDLFAFASGDHIEILRIVWTGPDTFFLTQPSVFHMVGMDWSRQSVSENHFVGLTLRSANGFAFDGELEAWVKDASGAEVPAPLDSLGLPARPVLASNEVQLAWFARRWPANLPANQPMQIRVAMADGTASTPWLRVHANGVEPRPFEPAIGRSPDEPEVLPDSVALDPVSEEASEVGGSPVREPVTPHVLRRTPLGGQTAIAFEIAEPTDVRVDVFDVSGRRVATLADRNFGPGAHVVPWDGRDLTGSRAPRGLYFVRLGTPRHVTGTKLVLDR
jgi:arabinan endo-1,5-alpha-L-arabinosidase